MSTQHVHEKGNGEEQAGAGEMPEPDHGEWLLLLAGLSFLTNPMSISLQVMLKDEDNKYCVDCDAKGELGGQKN